MADKSRNPEDQFHHDELKREIKASNKQISAIDDVLSEIKTGQKTESRAAAERGVKADKTASKTATAARRAAAASRASAPQGELDVAKQVQAAAEATSQAEGRTAKLLRAETRDIEKAGLRKKAADQQRLAQLVAERSAASGPAGSIRAAAATLPGKPSPKGELDLSRVAANVKAAAQAERAAAQVQGRVHGPLTQAQSLRASGDFRGALSSLGLGEPSRGSSAKLILSERRGIRESLSAEERVSQRIDAQRLTSARALRALALQQQIIARGGVTSSIAPGLRLQRPIERRVRAAEPFGPLTEAQAARASGDFRGTLAGGGGGLPPVLPPAPPAPTGPEGSRGPGELTAQQEKLAAASKRAEIATRAERQALDETARTIGLSGDQFRRHGALTSEFIAAAAKGQVTIKELGYQVTATIGKFAGWTAAASAVYGAAAAISKLGTGALDSLGGVTNLSRYVTGINTDKAQQSFRDLAKEFNLPIQVVADAATEASRVFKTQDDIFSATRTTLGAVSVAELKAGEAGQFLNAIYRGLGGTAQDLHGTLESANAITNKFGGTTADLVAGTAGAAAAFRNASKDSEGYAELLALIATGQAATGRSGKEIGTVIRRAAGQVLKPQKRQPLIDALGIDPSTHSLTELIVRAQKIFDKPSTTKEQKVAIASLITTPELASRGTTAILSSGKRFRERLATAKDPGKSVENEVARKNAAVRAQIAQVGTNLERLGSALAQSGFLTTLGAGLKILNTTLNIAVRLVEAFDKLPGPLRTSLAVLTEIAAVTALLRRVDAGSALANRFPTIGGALARNPVKLATAQAQQGIGYQKESVVARGNALAKDLNATQFQLLRAREREAASVGRLNAIPFGPETKANSGQRVKAQAEVLRHYENVNASERKAADLADDLDDATKQHTATLHQEKTIAEATRRNRVKTLDQLNSELRKVGIVHTNPTLDQQSDLRPIAVGTQADAQRQSGVPSPAVGGGGAPVTHVFRDNPAITRSENSLKKAVADQRRISSQIFRSSGTLSRVAGTAAGSISFAGKAVANTGKGMLSVGKAIAGSIGGFDVAIIGATALFASYTFIKKQLEDTDAAVSKLDKLTLNGSTSQIRAAANKELRTRSAFDKVQTGFAKAFNFLDPFGDPAQSPDQKRDQDARDALKNAKAIDAGRKHGVDLTGKEILDRLQTRLRRAAVPRKGDLPQDADGRVGIRLDVEYGKALRELERSRIKLRGSNSPAQRKLLAGIAAALKERVAEVAQLLGAGGVPTDLAGLTKFTTVNLPTNIALDGLKKKDVSQAAEAIRNARKIAKHSVDPEERAKALAAIQAAEQDILGPAQAQLDRLIKQARTPAQEGRARAQFARRIRKTFTGVDKPIGDALIRDEQVKQAQSVIADQESRRQSATAQFSLANFTDQGALLNRGVQDAQAAVADVKAAGDKLPVSALRDAMTKVFGAKQAVAEFTRAQAQELLTATANLAKANTDDPVKQAKIDEKLARDQGKFAVTPAQRTQNRADVKNAHKATIDTAVTKREDTIDFNLTLERITRSEAIRQLESLTKTANITKQHKRELLTKIKALKDQGDKDSGSLDLNLGNIKLPTLYDVRRLTGGGAPSTRLTRVENRNQVTVNVNGPQDYAELGRVLETSVKGSGASLARAGLSR